MLSPSANWLVLWSLWAARLVPQFTPAVRTSSGLVRGVVSPRGDLASYLAVPYARVEERFQIAKPVSPWRGVFDAVEEHVRCIQRFTSDVIVGREDCLTLNVYSPLPARRKPLPVMVFIHGGGFRDGSGSPILYGPDYLVRNDVILVTFNYRVEILGFLCLGLKEAPGNVGLKDQVAALRWVRENINVFGGDPNDVTLFGESAGAASVGFHILSPMSKDLFHKAIMQSGTPMAPWSMQFEPLKIARMVAHRIGMKTQDPSIIYENFKALKAEDLLQARVPRKEGDTILSESVFVPCVESPIPDVESFLTDTPYNLLTKGKYNKVPLIIGYNNAEGFMFASKENDTNISQLDFYNALPRDLTIPTEADQRALADFLQKYYMKDKTITKETMADFARFEGDSNIVYPVIITTDILLKTTDLPVYVYKFKYDGWMNLVKITFGYGLEPGATHADELFYMFKFGTTLPMAFWEKKFIDTISSLWTNFAKYGDPTPATTPEMPTRWNPSDRRNPQVQELDTTWSTSPLWQDEIMQFWNNTYTKYRRK